MITAETIAYNINGFDRITEESIEDPEHLGVWAILLSEDYPIHMGNYLDDSVTHYYCEVVQYVYNSLDGVEGADNDLSIPHFTQIFSDLPEHEQTNLTTIAGLNKARYPLTQLASTKNNKFESSITNGISRANVLQTQKTTFICKNFNQEKRYFRMASIKSDTMYGFFLATSRTNPDAFGAGGIYYPFSGAIGNQDGSASYNLYGNRLFLKSYPHIIMYMTPIYPDRVPRALKVCDAITLIMSSENRTWGENGYGFNCTVPFSRIPSQFSRFKVVFDSLHVLGTTSVSQTSRHNGSFPLHFVCYDWDKGAYGYGGDRNGGGHILTTTIPTLNYRDPNKISKLEVKQGSIIEIENVSRDIRFAFIMSQMRAPLTEMGIDPDSATGGGLLGYPTRNPRWEWNLSLKLYGLA